MSEPQIVCPKCRTAIRLTDSPAAPLLAKTRKQFEPRPAQQEIGSAKRETELRKQKDDLAKARKAIGEAVVKKLASARTTMARTEAQKARRALAGDLAQRDRQLAELQQHLDANAAKLAAAQKAQAAVLRKARELDDARRELELSVEQRVQEVLATVRSQAERDAETVSRPRSPNVTFRSPHAAQDRGVAPQGRPGLAATVGRGPRTRG